MRRLLGYNPVSIYVIGALDVVEFPEEMAATLTVPVLGTIGVATAFALFAALAVLVIEFFTTHRLWPSLIRAMLAGVVVWVPTPALGLLAVIAQIRK
jgi:hypothetical protein